MGRYVALDWGEKRIGIAVSDESHVLSQILIPALQNNAGFKKKFRLLKEKYHLEKVILGLPKNLRGETTKTGQSVLKFAELLKKTFNLPVELLDERFSSIQASARTRNFRASKARRAGEIDNQSAQILLETYLNKTRE